MDAPAATETISDDGASSTSITCHPSSPRICTTRWRCAMLPVAHSDQYDGLGGDELRRRAARPGLGHVQLGARAHRAGGADRGAQHPRRARSAVASRVQAPDQRVLHRRGGRAMGGPHPPARDPARRRLRRRRPVRLHGRVRAPVPGVVVLRSRAERAARRHRARHLSRVEGGASQRSRAAACWVGLSEVDQELRRPAPAKATARRCSSARCTARRSRTLRSPTRTSSARCILVLGASSETTAGAQVDDDQLLRTAEILGAAPASRNASPARSRSCCAIDGPFHRHRACTAT